MGDRPGAVKTLERGRVVALDLLDESRDLRLAVQERPLDGIVEEEMTPRPERGPPMLVVATNAAVRMVPVHEDEIA